MESPHPIRQLPEAAIRRIAPWRVVPALTALLLGLWGLERGGSLWRDESVTWQVAHRPLGGLWELLGQVDAVHGLYYLILHGVFQVWDGGLWALRLPSVAATALAAAGVAAIARRLAGERAALIAGVGYAVLPPVQMYAQEGRSYALVAAAVVWATYLMLRERWTAYAAVLLLGCWLHEFAVLALPAHAVTAWRSRGWRLAAGAVAVLLLPLALVSARQAGQQLGWLGRPAWQDWTAYGVLAVAVLLLGRPFRILSAEPTASGAVPGRAVGALAYWAYVVASAVRPGAVPGVAGPARSERDGPARGAAERDLVRVAVPLALLPPGVLMAVSLVDPWYVDRYVLYSLAGLALLAGARLAEVRLSDVRPGAARTGAARTGVLRGRWTARRGWPRPVVALLAALLVPCALWSVWLRTPESRKDDALAVAAAVREAARPGDAVVFLPSRRREWLLSSPRTYAALRDVALDRSPAASRSLQGTELPSAELRAALIASPRVIALLDPADEPLDPYPREAVKRQTLAAWFDLCSVTAVRGARVAVYAAPGTCAP